MSGLYECERCGLDMDPEEAQHTFLDCIDALKDEVERLKSAPNRLIRLDVAPRVPGMKDDSAELKSALEGLSYYREVRQYDGHLGIFDATELAQAYERVDAWEARQIQEFCDEVNNVERTSCP